MPDVLAVVNQKGGVGKTTTAVNLAAALAEAARPVLLVDLDPQANATSGLGVAPADHQAGTYPLLADDPHLHGGAARIVVPTQVPHLALIPSGPDLWAIDLELAGDRRRAYFRLRERLAAWAADFAVVILDCPPSLGTLTLNGLCAASSVIVPVQSEYYALEGLGQVVRTIEMVRGAFREDLRLGGIVLTLFDARNLLAHQVAEEVRRTFPGRVFRQPIPRDVRLAEAPGHRLPATLYAPTSRGAVAYRRLAQEVRRHLASRRRARHSAAASPRAARRAAPMEAGR